MQPEVGQFQFAGWNISFTTKGNSDIAILFIHGASSDQKIWKYLVEPSTEGMQWVTLDLLGHGESEKPEIQYNTELWVQNIKVLLDHLNIKKIILAGHSYGVIVIKHFYAAYREKVDAMILVDGSLKQVLSEGIYNWMKTTLERPDYEAYMNELNKDKQPFCLKKTDAKMVNEAVLQTPKYVLKGQLESMRADVDPNINIEVPVLAFYSNSHEWNRESEMYLKEHTKKLELHVWDNVSHFMMLEEPEKMRNIMIQFIQNHLL